MIELEWYWLLVLVPVPLFMRWLIKPTEPGKQTALCLPFLTDFTLKQQSRLGVLFNRFLWLLAFLAWCLLVLAAARPQWVDQIQQVPTSGRDLVLALDLSGSMQEKDFSLSGRRVNRLQAAKAVAKEFVERRRGDRIALVVFADQPYLLMPLSFDLNAVQQMLDETFIGLAGEKQTAIGDAMMMGLKHLQAHQEDKRVLILLTDGANNAGILTPRQATDYAVKEGMKVYTIGIGSDRQQLGFFIRRNNELDEKTLKMIANKTQGRYFRARDTKQLREIYALLDQIEPIQHDAESFLVKHALFPFFLIPALLLGGIALLIYARRRTL